jgi:hypothetical protein
MIRRSCPGDGIGVLTPECVGAVQQADEAVKTRFIWRKQLHQTRLHRVGQPNKAMQLTKLTAAPVLQAEVPPCAPAGRMDAGTASQLIRSVGRT